MGSGAKVMDPTISWILVPGSVTVW